MTLDDSRCPARRTALLASTGAVVLVAVLVGAVALAGQRSADDAAAAPDSTSSVSPTTGTSASSADGTASPAWPTAVTEADLMTSLSSVSIVWLGVWPDEGSTPPLALETELAALGYDPSPLRVACLDGSVDQLGLDPMVDHWGWPLYFRTAEEAEQFTALWSEPVVGVTEASIACDWG